MKINSLKTTNVVFLLILLAFIACQRQQSQHSETFKFLFSSEDKLFRQVDIGMTADSLKQLEPKKEKHEDLLGLTYEHKLGNGNSIFLEYYSDRKNQSQNITAIVANILDIAPTEQAELYDEIKKLFHQRYGPARGSYGKEYWEGETHYGKMDVHLKLLKSQQGLSINFVSK